MPKIIACGGDVNLRNSAGLTLLHKSILDGDSKNALFLLNHGADINARYVTIFFLKLGVHLQLILTAHSTAQRSRCLAADKSCSEPGTSILSKEKLLVRVFEPGTSASASVATDFSALLMKGTLDSLSLCNRRPPWYSG